MLPLILSILVGAGAGAALGYLGQCRSGACPLTATWPRGALFGAVLGWMLYLGPGREMAGARALRDTDGPVRAVGEAGFEAEVLRAEVPVVVDFYATWCGPCKAMAPALARLAEAYQGRVRFVKVDVDRESGLAAKYGVTALPTLVVFKAGAPVETLIGAADEKRLRSRLELLVATAPPR
jgi:thioredoxin 1